MTKHSTSHNNVISDVLLLGDNIDLLLSLWNSLSSLLLLSFKDNNCEMKTAGLPLDTSDSDNKITNDNINNDDTNNLKSSGLLAHEEANDGNNSNNNKMEEDLVKKTFSAANNSVNLSAANKPQQDFENATFTDITLDNDSKSMGVQSWPWDKMPLKNGLRHIAKTFDVAGLQAKREDKIVKVIIDACNV